MDEIPVITIDGPSASGKGTVAQRVAKQLAFHYLDSGSLYRLVALQAMRSKIDITDEHALADIAENLAAYFNDSSIMLNQEDVTDLIRSEECGLCASRIAAFPLVRAMLLNKQRAFRQKPGLVTDGRDMGSIIFPDASLKIFLTASAEERAQRRYKQLIEKGINANINILQQDIYERDARDSKREIAPLQQFADTKLLDTTFLNIDQAVNEVVKWYQAKHKSSFSL